jgi:hypothetical protein
MSPAARTHFLHAYNVLEGFEGALDQKRRRGTSDGWRVRRLPFCRGFKTNNRIMLLPNAPLCGARQ